MRRVGLVLGFVLLACTQLNPAFDERDELGEGESGDGDPGDGDPGDGDPGDGDPGDGDPGDGDPGDGDPGDGDPGDGDPGDGDPGDGDPGDGDGDGDGDPIEECAAVILEEAYQAATTLGALIVDVSNAPGFATQLMDCQILTICVSDQPTCNSASEFLVRVNSGGLSLSGNAIPMEPTRIRMHFTPGKPSCGLPPLSFDPSQFIEIHWVENNMQKFVPVRLPCFEGTDLELWVGIDGSSFYDPDLFQAAALW